MIASVGTRRFGLGIVAAAFLSTAVGCTGDLKLTDRSLHELSYPEVVELLSKNQANNKERPTVLIDVRAPTKFSQDHIADALNIPLPRMVSEDPRLLDAKTIVVYGDSPTDVLPTAAAKKLMALGYPRVYNYRGGLEDWRSRSATHDTPNP